MRPAHFTTPQESSKGHSALSCHDHWETIVTTIAIAGAVGWLLIIAAGLRFGAAAKRGDEIADAAFRNRELPQGYARVIRLDRARPGQRSGAATLRDRSGVHCGVPLAGDAVRSEDVG